MDTVGIRTLKAHLSEYVRRARSGERIRVSSHGEVVAELGPAKLAGEEGVPAGLTELARLGLARRVVRNDPSRYTLREPVLSGTTAKDLLDWVRGDR